MDRKHNPHDMTRTLTINHIHFPLVEPTEEVLANLEQGDQLQVRNHTDYLVMYMATWPTGNLDVYSNAGQQQVLFPSEVTGVCKKGTAY